MDDKPLIITVKHTWKQKVSASEPIIVCLLLGIFQKQYKLVQGKPEQMSGTRGQVVLRPWQEHRMTLREVNGTRGLFLPSRQLSDPPQASEVPTCVPTHSCASRRGRQGRHGLPLWIWSWVSGPVRPPWGFTGYWEMLPWPLDIACSVLPLSPGLRGFIALLPPQKVRALGEQSSYPVDWPFCHHETGHREHPF